MNKALVLSLKLKIVQILVFFFSATTLSAPENRILPSRDLGISMFSAPFACPVGSRCDSFGVFPFGITKPEASLKGSPESLIWQNHKFDREGLGRIKNDEELEGMISSGALVPLPLGNCLTASEKELVPKWRFVLSRTARLLQDLSEAICPEFRLALQVNSAVRHVQRQIEIGKTNLNAASVSGPKASPHLTGAAIDIAILSYPEEFVERLKKILLELEAQGAIDATLEENSQIVLHVSVFK